jgi:hypothetical protein
MSTLRIATSLLIAWLQAACTGEVLDQDLEDESVAEAEEALVIENALSPNALSPNALSPNALSPNALSPNALSPNAMMAITDANPDGVTARALLKYTVSCALDATKSFNFSWADAGGVVHNELYTGLLGLAPEWATGPLTDDTHKRMVSACLAARVNYYGVSVIISIRSAVSPLTPTSGSSELTQYSYIEGAFWGNLFTASPYLNTCYFYANVNHSWQAQRDCAMGHLDGQQVLMCGMMTLRGTCKDVCQKLSTSGQYYPSCPDNPAVQHSPTTSAVITTALP